MSTKLLLHQFLSKSGKFKSKLDVVDAIHNGDVKVDNEVITNKQYQFNPNSRTVTYRGESLTQVDKIYIAMNKPERCICSRLNKPEKDLDKKSVFDVVKPLNLPLRVEQSLFTVGRLDEDTTGLLLLTNDGDFCNKIINAESHIPKVYLASLSRPITDAQHRALKEGVTIELEEDGKISHYKTRPAKVEIDVENRNNIFITIDEGKKRQIRRMFDAVGNSVEQLQRISIGGLTLASLRLKIGQCVKVEPRILDEIIDIEKEARRPVRD